MRKSLVLILISVVALSIFLIQLITSLGIDGDNIEVNTTPSIISVEDILNNRELKTGILKAVKSNDAKAIDRLQNKAVEIAVAAGFDESQMKRVSGSSARDYLVFRAKRELFYMEFQQRYQELSYIDDLKLKYPEAQSLFAQADSLIAQRDKNIMEIAQILADSEQNYEAFLDAAKAEWMSRQNRAELE